MRRVWRAGVSIGRGRVFGTSRKGAGVHDIENILINRHVGATNSRNPSIRKLVLIQVPAQPQSCFMSRIPVV